MAHPQAVPGGRRRRPIWVACMWIQSAERASPAAHWADLADALPVIQARLPAFAAPSSAGIWRRRRPQLARRRRLPRAAAGRRLGGLPKLGEQSSKEPARSHQSTPAPAPGRMMAVLRVAHPQPILSRHRATAGYDAKRPGLGALASGTSCRVVVSCHTSGAGHHAHAASHATCATPPLAHASATADADRHTAVAGKSTGSVTTLSLARAPDFSPGELGRSNTWVRVAREAVGAEGQVGPRGLHAAVAATAC